MWYINVCMYIHCTTLWYRFLFFRVKIFILSVCCQIKTQTESEIKEKYLDLNFFSHRDRCESRRHGRQCTPKNYKWRKIHTDTRHIHKAIDIIFPIFRRLLQVASKAISSAIANRQLKHVCAFENLVLNSQMK